MFTENYTEETTKIYEMTKVIFTEVICYSDIAERTEWIFPRNVQTFLQAIRIKRKYLLVVRRKSSEEGHTADA